VPHDATLDGTPPPPPQPAEPGLLHTPSGLVNASDVTSTGTEQITGASKARTKPTAAGVTPASAPKSKDKKKGKQEGVKEFTQRKLHEMKGITPLSKKRTDYSSGCGMEGTGEADALPSSSLVAPPPHCASHEKPQKQAAILPPAGAAPPSVPNWQKFVPLSTPCPPAASLPPPPGAAAPAALQSPPSVVSKTWKGLSPTPAINLNIRQAAVPVAPKHKPLDSSGLDFLPSASRPLPVPPHAVAALAGANPETTPLPSFGQFAFNAKSAKPSLVQQSNEVPTAKNPNPLPRQRAASGGRSAVPGAGAKDDAITAQPKKRIKLANTPSSLNWLSTKYKTASAVRKETPENHSKES